MNFSDLQNLQGSTTLDVLLFILFLWSSAWKGFALWHAASEKERNWFIVILVVNTAGILEIVYLFFAAKEKLTIGEAGTRLKSLIKK